MRRNFMLELHGWITLRESYKANDEEKNMKHIFGKIKGKVYELDWTTNLLDIRYCNGSPNLSIALFANRIGQEVNDVFELLEFICKEAKGSYGLIYVCDDEMSDDFMCYIICKGNINKVGDPFLSPLSKKIYEE